MESVNIFSTSRNIKPSIGWIPSKVGSSSIGSEVLVFINGIGLVDYSMIGGTIVSAATYTPQAVIAQPTTHAHSVKANELFLPDASLGLDFPQNWGVEPQRVVNSINLWKKNLNFYSINEFIGEFALKYKIIDYEKVYQLLLENELLAPLVNQAIKKIEEYYKGAIKNLYLKVQADPEDEEDYYVLYLGIESTGNIQDADTLLTKFRTEWLIPTLGAKILLFNVTLI